MGSRRLIDQLPWRRNKRKLNQQQIILFVIRWICLENFCESFIWRKGRENNVFFMAELFVNGQILSARDFEEPTLFCKWSFQFGK